MKKLLCFILTISIITGAAAAVPFLTCAKTSFYYYTVQDFNGADDGKISVVNEADDPSAYKKYRITGEDYDWYTAQYTASNSPSFSYTAPGDDMLNPTGFIQCTGKNQYPNLTMEMKDPKTGEALPASGPEGVLYIDMRIYRNPAKITTNQDMYLYDSQGRNILSVYWPQNSVPRINAVNNKTGITADAACAEQSKSEWFYMQFIIDFNTETFKANMGLSLDDMEPCSLTCEEYPFKQAGAKDFYKIQFGVASLAKSAVCIDDFRVYAITGLEYPLAQVSVSGGESIGSDLIGRYSYSEIYQGTPEGISYACWQRSDSPDFIEYETVKEVGECSAGTDYEYTITSEDSGKYLRFCVIPVTQEGTEGEMCFSSPSGLINSFVVNISGSGAFADSMFDIDDGIGEYGAKAEIYNSTAEDKSVYLISAWYEGNVMKEMALDRCVSSAGSGTKLFEGTKLSVQNPEGLTLKVFALRDMQTIDNIGLPCVYSGIYDSSKEIVRYEAEDAVLSGNAVVKNGADYSGGKCVTGFKAEGDSCTFTVTIKKTNHYNLNFVSAGDGGSKTNYIDIDGVRYGELITPTTSLGDAVAERVYLEKGTHLIKLSSYWGWIFLDYLEVSASSEPNDDIFNVEPALVNKNASQSTVKLMEFLCKNYGKNILAGQTCYDGMNGAEFNAVRNLTGKTPAVLGLDMMEYSPSRIAHGATDDSIESAIEFDKAGGIVTFCWHWNAPEKFLINSSSQPWYRGFYTEAVTGLDLAQILADKDGEDYQLLISDMDAIAQELARLRDADVPVLWRPLHEGSGGWFWWGSAGADAYKELWRIMYDRFTNYHGLNNLIWVYNGQSADWYPGDEYVDIIGEDIYAGNHVYSSQYDRFSAASQYTSVNKIIALTENGCVPDPDLMIRDGAMWSWFATWGGEYVIDSSNQISESYTSKEMLMKVYSHENVLTLDELPDYKNQ